MRGLAAGLLCLAGCVPRLEADLALDRILSPETRLIFLTLGDATDPASPVVVLDPWSPQAVDNFVARGGARVELAAYPWTLEGFGLAAYGELSRETGDDTRALPLAERTLFAAELTPGELSWSATPEPGAALAGLRLPRIDALACAEGGGCFDERLGRALCATPCPASAEPAPPRPAAAPAEAAGPSLLPCPEGWVAEASAELTLPGWCGSPPLPAPVACAPGEAQGWRRPACDPLGGPCPSGQWAELPESPAPIYVLAGAPPGGDGGRGAPFATIGAALAAGTVGRPLALSGRFSEELTLDRPVHLAGTCAALTSIELGPTGARISAPGVVISGLELRASGTGILADGPGTALTVDRVAIEAGAPGAGAGVTASEGATVVVSRSAVRGFAAGCVQARGGAHLSLERSVLEGCGTAGLRAEDAGTSVATFEVAVRDALPGAGDDTSGVGVDVAAGAVVDLSRTSIERCSGAGVRADGSAVSLSQVDVREVGAVTRAGGHGVVIGAGSELAAERLSIASASAAGISLAGAGTTATITGAIVRDMASDRDGKSAGITATDGAALALERVVVSRAGSQGISVAQAHLAGRDVAILETRGDPNGVDGPGLRLAGGTAHLARLHVERVRAQGIRLRRGVTASLEDISILDVTAPSDDRLQAIAFLVEEGASGTLVRGRISRAAFRGAWVVGAHFDLSDVSVRENGLTGVAAIAEAVKVEDGSSTMARILVEDSAGDCLAAGGVATATVADLTCRRIERQSGVNPEQRARGLMMYDGPRVSLARALLEDVDGDAVTVGAGGVLLATDVHIVDPGRRGLRLEGGDLVLERALLSGCTGDAIMVEDLERGGDAQVDLAALDVRVERTRAAAEHYSTLANAAIHLRNQTYASVRRFEIEDSEVSNLVINDESILELSRGIVGEDRYGSVIDDPSYDLGRLMDLVTFIEPRLIFAPDAQPR